MCYFTRAIHLRGITVTAAQFMTDLNASGRYCFSSDEAVQALGTSAVATRAALRRLRQKGELAMPYKGFYVIVPPEFRNDGCLPASHFIPFLMEHLGDRYYAGLLSAAEYHGAAHQRPQVFQVVLAKNRPAIACGKIRIIFVARKNAAQIPTMDFKTPRGYLKISTPEATAFDLVGYPNHAAGLDNTATVLAELAQQFDGKELVRMAELSPVAWAQRLGYLLDLVGAREKTAELAKYVTGKDLAPTPLAPSRSFEGIGRLKPWNILVNISVEVEV
ncbi:MAG: type IV toxin-antitoxin system AbiEi family antitoxin [Deltaproteobacteria bacterium]|nr:type IV toxin-antitoxin system AbiEi family antitoxin [Deltaproteobacteria bacterium]